MTEENKTFTLEEAHHHFARTLNGEVWGLMEKAERSKEDDERMLYAANASCYHWLHAGNALNQQRGEWMIARVLTILGRTEAAILHAQRCLELTEQHKDLMQDFDLAYCYEALARANALAKNKELFAVYVQKAQNAGEAIKSEEDRKYFDGDLAGGEWYGMK